MKPIHTRHSGKIRAIPFLQPHPHSKTSAAAGTSSASAGVQSRLGGTFALSGTTAKTADVQTRMGTASMPPFQQNFEGVDLNGGGDPCGCYPPDTNMAVGPSDIVQTVNTAFGIWDKQGNQLLAPEDLGTIWQGLGGSCDPSADSASYDGGDPIVMYDESANRWFISQLSYPGGSQGYHECMAVSKTGDPTGAYYRYDFLFSTNTLNDYPKFGVWPDGYYMSADDFLGGSTFTGITVVAFDRQAMLAGDPAQSVTFTLPDPNLIYLVPSSTEGALLGQSPPAGAPDPFFMSCDPNSPYYATSTCSQNQLDEWNFHVDWSNPANSTFGGSNGAPNLTLPTDPYNGNLCDGSNSCIPQPGTSSTLEPSADHLEYRAAYRNIGGTPTVVLSQTVNVSSDPPATTQAAINWYELTNTGSGWAIADQGTYAPDSNNRWMSNTNIDASGDIATGYSVDNGTSLYPSVAVAGRLAGDPAGQLSQGEQMMVTGSNSQSANRWGDYSAMQVDPTDGCTFWYTQEYAGTTGSVDWKTRIGSFKYSTCSITPPGTISGKVTDTSTGDPVANATVAISGGNVETSTFTDSQGAYSVFLPPGTYTETVSAFGYQTQTISNVQVTSGQDTTENEALSQSPSVHLSGTVTDGSGHGWPLYATITVAGDPNGPFWTSPATGQYNITIPADATYSVTYTPTLPGYQARTDSVDVAASNATNNAAIAIDTTACDAPGYSASSGSCAPVPGGLVVGTVRDSNTGAAVNGATVTSGDNPSDTATTVATPDDPAVGGGYYQLFSSLTGSHSFTVTKPLANGAGYTPTTQTVSVAADGATEADFKASAGELAVSPTSVSNSLVLGKSATTTLKITNTGTAPATFNLDERQGAAQILGKQGAPLQRVTLDEDQEASPGWLGGQPTAAKPARPGTSAGTQQSSGNAWSTIADYPDKTGVQDNAADYLDGNLYSVGGIDSSQILNTAYAYNIYTGTWRQLANMPTSREKPGAAFVNGKLYVAGGWSTVNTNGYPVAETDVYNPSSDAWSRVSDNPNPAAAPGVAVANGKIYFVGGCLDAACSATSETTTKVLRYDPATDSWTSVAAYPHKVAWASCGGIGGKIYCAGGTDAVNTYSDAYVYNPATDAWSPIASLPLDLWGAAGGAANGLLVLSTGVTSGGNVITNQGYAYDPSTNTWAALPNAQDTVLRAGGACGFYKIGGDNSGGFTPTASGEGLSGLDQCGTTDVPWLSESPASATLQPGQSTTVSVTLSATAAAGISQPGTYTAQLGVTQSTPYLVAPVDVTMTVTPPNGWGKVTGTVTGLACSGSSAPLHGAQVQASGTNGFTFTQYTGSDGTYSVWAPAADNPIMLTAGFTGWSTQIQKVSLRAGKTITANFTLQQNCG